PSAGLRPAEPAQPGTAGTAGSSLAGTARSGHAAPSVGPADPRSARSSVGSAGAADADTDDAIGDDHGALDGQTTGPRERLRSRLQAQFEVHGRPARAHARSLLGG